MQHSHASVNVQLHPMEALSHDCGRPITLHGNYHTRLRQTYHNPLTPSHTATTNSRYPMETVLHVCDRPTRPWGTPLALLRQTNHNPWIRSRMGPINNLRIFSQTQAHYGSMRPCCQPAFFSHKGGRS